MNQVGPDENKMSDEGESCGGSCLICGSWLLAGIFFPCGKWIFISISILMVVLRDIMKNFSNLLRCENCTRIWKGSYFPFGSNQESRRCCWAWSILYFTVYWHLYQGIFDSSILTESVQLKWCAIYHLPYIINGIWYNVHHMRVKNECMNRKVKFCRKSIHFLRSIWEQWVLTFHHKKF